LATLVGNYIFSLAVSNFGIMSIGKPIVFYLLIKYLPYFEAAEVAPEGSTTALHDASKLSPAKQVCFL
jgi:hypothetical protein